MLTSVMLLLPPVVLHPRLYHHLDAEILSVGSANDMVIFILSVETRVLFVSEQSEWESGSEHEDNGEQDGDESKEETIHRSNIQTAQGLLYFPTSA